MATAGAFAVVLPLLLRLGLRASGAALARPARARLAARLRGRRASWRRARGDPLRARAGDAARRSPRPAIVGVLAYWAAYYALVLDPEERELVRGLLGR